MTDVGDRSNEIEERTRRLRVITTIGLAGDVVVSLVLLLLREPSGLGDVAFIFAAFLIASGVSMFIFLPMLPRMSQSRSERTDNAAAGSPDDTTKK